MAVGTYKLPICDGCKLPWLPAGWTQESDPRDTKKPLRCGKCKSSGWDREHKAEVLDNPAIEVNPEILRAANEPLEADAPKMHHHFGGNDVPRGNIEDSEPIGYSQKRCRHRITNCPICSKEAAKDA